jgi:hypothetical protein
MLLVLPDGNRLEPVELPAGTTLVDDKKACITYEEKPAASICMSGKTVRVLALKYE